MSKTTVRFHPRKTKHGATLVSTHKRLIKSRKRKVIVDPVPVVSWTLRDAETKQILGQTSTPPDVKPLPKNYSGLFGLFTIKEKPKFKILNVNTREYVDNRDFDSNQEAEQVLDRFKASRGVPWESNTLRVVHVYKPNSQSQRKSLEEGRE
jgi:hypothetical protein